MDPLPWGRPLGIARWEMRAFLIPVIITPWQPRTSLSKLSAPSAAAPNFRRRLPPPPPPPCSLRRNLLACHAKVRESHGH